MSNKIEQLKSTLADMSRNAAEIESAIQAEYNKIFDADPKLQAAIKACECSQEYTWAGGDEIAAWVRFYPRADSIPYLATYLQDQYYMYWDYKNEALLRFVGPAILIDDNGDVYDQDRNQTVIRRSEYDPENTGDFNSERNRLIEAYMEKTGCFPGVFRTDRHGNVFNVNTKD